MIKVTTQENLFRVTFDWSTKAITSRLKNKRGQLHFVDVHKRLNLKKLLSTFDSE